MTAEALFDVLYSWANKVLNLDVGNPSDTIPVIRAQENAPAPSSGPYIVISRSPVVDFPGRPSQLDVSNSTGKRKLSLDTKIKIEVWEVNSDGDLLKTLFQSLYRQDISALFDTAGIAFVDQMSPIQDLSVLQGDAWRYEHMIELVLHGVETIEETTGIIAHTEIEGKLSPEGTGTDRTLNFEED